MRKSNGIRAELHESAIVTEARQSRWLAVVFATWATHARPDGSYVYDGLGINATISKRGDVTFVAKRVSDPELRFQPPLEPSATLTAERSPGGAAPLCTSCSPQA